MSCNLSDRDQPCPMKAFQVFLASTLLASVNASDSTNLGNVSYNGKVHQDCRATQISADGVQISSRQGSFTIPLDKAPTSVLMGFDKKDVEEAKKAFREKQALARVTQSNSNRRQSLEEKYPNYSKFFFKVEENLTDGAVGRKVKRVPYMIPAISSSLGQVGGGINRGGGLLYNEIPQGTSIFVQGMPRQRLGETIELECNKNGFYERSIGGNGFEVLEKWDFLSGKK
jgi:hypothetical protein